MSLIALDGFLNHFIIKDAHKISNYYFLKLFIFSIIYTVIYVACLLWNLKKYIERVSFNNVN